jgi:hypothetical protein
LSHSGSPVLCISKIGSCELARGCLKQ